MLHVEKHIFIYLILETVSVKHWQSKHQIQKHFQLKQAVHVISTQICRFYWLLRATGQNIRYSGVNCALGPSKSIRYSGIPFHIFYCNSVGLSDVFRYNGVLVTTGFVIAEFHCITRTYWTKLYINPVFSFVRVIIIQLWFFFSGNQQSIISFIKIKNLISLNCHTYPKIQEPTYFARLQKSRFLLVGIYRWITSWFKIMITD